MALSRITEKAKYANKNMEVLIAALLDIEDAFDNTVLEPITHESRRKVIDETSCKWIDCIVRQRYIQDNYGRNNRA